MKELDEDKRGIAPQLVETPASASVPSEPVTVLKLEQLNGDLTSVIIQDYVDTLPAAVVSASRAA